MKQEFEIVAPENLEGELLEGRRAAVETAKRLSRERGRSVELLRADRSVRMRFRDGRLEYYHHELRHGRSA